MADRPTDILRPTDDQAVRLARTLLRSARQGALGTLDPADGFPIATRVGVATDIGGAPVLLVSSLAQHTGALRADCRCSLLLGQAGKGDPLAHARITLRCEASELARDSEEGRDAARRYLNRHPKAALYAGFTDFAFFRLQPLKATLNGGFGRAYALTTRDLLCTGAVVAELAECEQEALDRMNADQVDAVQACARSAGLQQGAWRLIGIDPDGLDLMAGDRTSRIFFPEPLAAASQLGSTLAKMAQRRSVATDIPQ